MEGQNELLTGQQIDAVKQCTPFNVRVRRDSRVRTVPEVPFDMEE